MGQTFFQLRTADCGSGPGLGLRYALGLDIPVELDVYNESTRKGVAGKVGVAI